MDSRRIYRFASRVLLALPNYVLADVCAVGLCKPELLFLYTSPSAGCRSPATLCRLLHYKHEMTSLAWGQSVLAEFALRCPIRRSTSFVLQT
jgi:hypothetical protein